MEEENRHSLLFFHHFSYNLILVATFLIQQLQYSNLGAYAPNYYNSSSSALAPINIPVIGLSATLLLYYSSNTQESKYQLFQQCFRLFSRIKSSSALSQVITVPRQINLKWLQFLDQQHLIHTEVYKVVLLLYKPK